MNTKHTCPICKGSGSIIDRRLIGCAITTTHDPCGLCDGNGCLPAPLASVALRYKRKAEMLQQDLMAQRDDLTLAVGKLRECADLYLDDLLSEWLWASGGRSGVIRSPCNPR